MFGLSRKLFVGRRLVVGHLDERLPFRCAEFIKGFVVGPGGLGGLKRVDGLAMGRDEGVELRFHNSER